MNPRPSLRRDIGIALVLKIALLAAIYAACFAPSRRAPANIPAHLFDASPIETTEPR